MPSIPECERLVQIIPFFASINYCPLVCFAKFTFARMEDGRLSWRIDISFPFYLFASWRPSDARLELHVKVLDIRKCFSFFIMKGNRIRLVNGASRYLLWTHEIYPSTKTAVLISLN
jgi:hypothetical protein